MRTLDWVEVVTFVGMLTLVILGGIGIGCVLDWILT